MKRSMEGRREILTCQVDESQFAILGDEEVFITWVGLFTLDTECKHAVTATGVVVHVVSARRSITQPCNIIRVTIIIYIHAIIIMNTFIIMIIIIYSAAF